ncbi:MAG: SDR family oxidoreductase [Acidimicrobiales bacterium]
MTDTTSATGSAERDDGRPVAIVADAAHYVGPELARRFAAAGFDLVVGQAPDDLVAELEAAGATVAVAPGARDVADPASAPSLVTTALEGFGRIDSAVAFSGVIVTGNFTDSTADDLGAAVRGCLEAPYHFLRAVTEPMIEAGAGQVLVITSAAGARPTPGAPLYSAARAGANMLVRNVAGEIARHGVQVNAVGTNFMDFPEFLRATGGEDPAVRTVIEGMVPMKRLGTMAEFAAFCMPFVDGSSRFTTGQFVAYAGGWA